MFSVELHDHLLSNYWGIDHICSFPDKQYALDNGSYSCHPSERVFQFSFRNGDHIHTNFKDMYLHLRSSGYFIEVLG